MYSRPPGTETERERGRGREKKERRLRVSLRKPAILSILQSCRRVLLLLLLLLNREIERSVGEKKSGYSKKSKGKKDPCMTTQRRWYVVIFFSLLCLFRPFKIVYYTKISQPISLIFTRLFFPFKIVQCFHTINYVLPLMIKLRKNLNL